MVFQLLESLLVNKERYGYMSCPCRLAAGVYELDKDIICPCVYSFEDLAEFGSCFCGLYVNAKVAQGKQESGMVPESRPQDKILAGL